MNMKLIKVLGLGASVVGVAATLLGNWVGEKAQDAKIAEKVAEALAKTKGES